MFNIVKFMFLMLNHTQYIFPNCHYIRYKKQIIFIAFIFFSFLSSPSIGFSAEKAHLVGKVIDKISGIPIENTLVYLEPGFRYAETNAQGEYEISGIEPGIYQISTKHVGYNSDQKQKVELKRGEIKDANFILTEMYYSSSDAIVVTATRGRSTTQELPHSMSIVSQERISLIKPLNISEVLQNIQGIYIKDYGGVGDLKTISLRGSNPEQVLVLLDGQRLNNPQTGQIDLSMISLEEIEQVEILRGGSSAVYGADAIGGVLNMITRKSQTPTGIGASLHLLGGSFNTRSLDAAIDFESQIWDGSFTYKQLRSDGDFTYTDSDGQEQTRTNNDVHSHNFFTTIKSQLGQSPYKTNLDMSYGYFTAERGAPGPTDFPSQTARQWDTNQQFQTALRGKVFNPLHTYNLQGFWNWNKTRFEEPEGFFATDARNKSGNYGIESHIKSLILPHHALTYGLGYRKEWMTSNQFPENHNRNLYFIFVQDEIQLNANDNKSPIAIEIIPAIRYDSYSDFGSRWSPKIGGSMSVGSEWQTTLKSNAGLNFRAPTFNELYWPKSDWSSGNQDLKPENGFDWDLGLSLRYPDFLNIAFNMVYFDIRMNDLIQWQTDSLFFSMPVNISKARNRGIEVNSSIELVENMLEIIGNYTYLDARNLSDGEYNNKFLVYRSRHNLNLTFNWQWKYLSFVYDYRYVSRRYSDEANSNEFELKSYDVSDLTLRFKKRYGMWQPTLSFQIRNVFNENYQIIRSYPLPGREIRISLEVAYK
jgi:outer membrane cobalamin receptor